MILISTPDGGNKVSLTYRECQAKLKEYEALNYSIPRLNSKKSVLEDAIEEISHQILLTSCLASRFKKIGVQKVA